MTREEFMQLQKGDVVRLDDGKLALVFESPEPQPMHSSELGVRELEQGNEELEVNEVLIVVGEEMVVEKLSKLQQKKELGLCQEIKRIGLQTGGVGVELGKDGSQIFICVPSFLRSEYKPGDNLPPDIGAVPIDS